MKREMIRPVKSFQLSFRLYEGVDQNQPVDKVLEIQHAIGATGGGLQRGGGRGAAPEYCAPEGLTTVIVLSRIQEGRPLCTGGATGNTPGG